MGLWQWPHDVKNRVILNEGNQFVKGLSGHSMFCKKFFVVQSSNLVIIVTSVFLQIVVMANSGIVVRSMGTKQQITRVLHLPETNGKLCAHSFDFDQDKSELELLSLESFDPVETSCCCCSPLQQARAGTSKGLTVSFVRPRNKLTNEACHFCK